MKTIHCVTALLFATTLTAGCGDKQKQAEEPKAVTTATTGDVDTNTDKVEKVTGDLREALLHLRRVHFALDTDELLPDSKTALQLAGEKLTGYPNVHIYIDGHTDERGTSEYNLGLGERRAKSVSDYLMRLGVTQERLHATTFGEEQLMADGSDAVANAKNRRAEFRLMRGDVRLIVDDGVMYNDKGKKLSQ